MTDHRLNEPEPDQVDVPKMHLGLTREHGEPREGHEPMPLWLPVLIVALLVWAGYYVGRYGGTFDANSYDPVRMGPGSAPTGIATGSPTERGQTVFRMACVSCHQESGEGIPGQYPPLAESAVLTGNAEIPVRIVLYGLSGPVTVLGKQYNGNMPAWGGSLNDEQIADVLTFARGAWGNKAQPVKPEEVKKVRDANASRNRPWTAQELGLHG